MTSTAKLYINEIRHALKYHGVWLPGTPLSPGIIGEVRDGTFVPIDNLKEGLGITVDLEPGSTAGTESLLYQSQAGVVIQTKASGATSNLFKGVAEAEAGVAVRFSRQGACVLSLQQYHTQRLAGQLRLQRELLKKIDHRWKHSYVIVTETITAQTGTILVCEDSKAYIEISAKGGTTNPIADIGNARLDLKVAHTEGRIFSIIGSEKLTPLFRGIRVTESLLKTLSIGSYGDGNERVAEDFTDEQVENMFEPFEL